MAASCNNRAWLNYISHERYAGRLGNGWSVMFVKYRPVRLKDLVECVECVRSTFGYRSEQELADLVDFWRELLSTGAACGAVMEDAGEGIVWFSLKVFVEDAYVQFLKTEAAPFVGREVLRSWLKGSSPCLGAREIRRANSTTGVNILVLCAGAPERMRSATQMRGLADLVVDFSRYCGAGYRCKELLQEFYDDFTCAWATGAGFRLRSDYARSELGCDDVVHPKLYGVTAAEAAESAGTLVSTIFKYEPPRFFFRPNEQELLIEALVGETDEMLAMSLGVAVVTVRKRWDAIYDRVADVLPDMLQSPKSTDGAARGTEKKRQLLSYLRQHPEELRPCENLAGSSTFAFKNSPLTAEALRWRLGPKVGDNQAVSA